VRYGYDVIKSDWTRTEPQRQVDTTCTNRFSGINCIYVLSTILKHIAVIFSQSTNRMVFQMAAQCSLRDANRISTYNVDTF
jgi:hypothetical protein